MTGRTAAAVSHTYASIYYILIEIYYELPTVWLFIGIEDVACYVGARPSCLYYTNIKMYDWYDADKKRLKKIRILSARSKWTARDETLPESCERVLFVAALSSRALEECAPSPSAEIDSLRARKRRGQLFGRSVSDRHYSTIE